jgi:hypothetical protein
MAGERSRPTPTFGYFGMSVGFFIRLQVDYELMERRRQIEDDPAARGLAGGANIQEELL